MVDKSDDLMVALMELSWVELMEPYLAVRWDDVKVDMLGLTMVEVLVEQMVE